MSLNIIAQPANYVNDDAITASIILKSIGKNKIKKITIDECKVKNIRRRADYEIERFMPKRVVFDFDSVTFMDSAGIGMVIGRYKQTAMLGGKMALANLTESVRKIFEMSGVLRLIPEVELSKDYLEENKEEEVI